MIYTRWGDAVTVGAYCGQHAVKGFPAPMILLRVKYAEDGATRHAFGHTLKADGGINEVDAAVDAAPEVVLAGAALERALAEAS